jgi:hypothetical protein
MPVVLRFKGYRFEFYESDNDERAHVHACEEKRKAREVLACSEH